MLGLYGLPLLLEARVHGAEGRIEVLFGSCARAAPRRCYARSLTWFRRCQSLALLELLTHRRQFALILSDAIGRSGTLLPLGRALAARERLGLTEARRAGGATRITRHCLARRFGEVAFRS